MAAELASLTMTPNLNAEGQARESFRVSTKESTSLFFYNASIFLVSMKPVKAIRLSQEFKTKAWTRCPHKVTDAHFYEGQGNKGARSEAFWAVV